MIDELERMRVEQDWCKEVGKRLQDAGVGKSCLVHRFVSDAFNAASMPTIGLV